MLCEADDGNSRVPVFCYFSYDCQPFPSLFRFECTLTLNMRRGASSAPGEQRFTHHTEYEYAMTVFAVPSVLLVLPDCDDIGIFHVLGHSSLLPDRGVSGVSQGLVIWHTRAMVGHHCFLNSTCLSS